MASNIVVNIGSSFISLPAICKAITLTDAVLLQIEPLQTNYGEILEKVYVNAASKMVAIWNDFGPSVTHMHLERFREWPVKWYQTKMS